MGVLVASCGGAGGSIGVGGDGGGGGCLAFLARLLHAEEPGAPVEEDDSHLERQWRQG